MQARGTGRTFDVEERQASVDQLRAQLVGAKWNLEKTTVRAPEDGYLTNLALRKGARVATSTALALIDTSDTIIGAEINQIDARYIAPGQLLEAIFKYAPGQVFTGKVESLLQAIAAGQTQVSGAAVTPVSIQSAPFIVRVRLDDRAFAATLPPAQWATRQSSPSMSRRRT